VSLLRVATALLLTGLAACGSVERNMSMTNGMLRIEPHPIHADSVRIVTISSTVLADPLGRGTPNGYRNVVDSLFGQECYDAPIIEEGRVRMQNGREDAALRVICPAVVRRS
jgi:hypothetical protein